jgi:hypothetical protein
MEYELTKSDWEIAKRDNIALIKQCNMQILMANNILTLIEEEVNKIVDNSATGDNKIDEPTTESRLKVD